MDEVRRVRTEPGPRARWSSGLAFLAGLAALAWFLVRVIPKPSRATYPCQRVAFPLASSFVLWVLGLAGAILAFRRARACMRRARYALAGTCVAVGIGLAVWGLGRSSEPAAATWDPSDGPNQPIGVAKGIHPGRVVWAHEPDATSWNGSSNYWWTDGNTDPGRVEAMLSRSLRTLAGERTDEAAWRAVFRHFNRTHGRGDRGYEAGEGVAIKINLNVSPDYAATNEPIPTPQLVRGLLRQLIEVAGVTESAIAVYDASRCIPDAVFAPCHAAFPAVTFVDNDGRGDRDTPVRDTTVAVHYADSRVGSSGTTRLPTCVVRATYFINMALLRGHSLAGVTLCAKNLFGSVWQTGSTTDGGWTPSNIHATINRSSNPMGRVNSLVDLMGHEHLGGKALLFIIDALYGAVNQGSAAPARWRMAPFNNDWTSSLFISQDGVAIDSVGLDFCRSEPALAGTVTGQSVDNYLHEAALANDPPSRAFYDPEGDGTRLASLGVHEHWDGATGKRYSRNLGTGDGIELVMAVDAPPQPEFVRGDANADGALDLGDAIATLSYLFADAQAPPCLASADANDTGGLDLSDAIHILSYLFASGDPPPAPAGACGADPTPDDLGCEAFPPCGVGG